MGPNGFIQSVQVLRQLIAGRHSFGSYVVATNMRENGGAIRKLNWLLSGVFEKDQRQSRLSALSALVSRQIISTVGDGGLTKGEAFALLDWCVWVDHFPMLEPDAEGVLIKLRDNPQKWVSYINKHLSPMTIPGGRMYEQTTHPAF